MLKKGHGRVLLAIGFLLSATRCFGVQTGACVLSFILLVGMFFNGDSEETCNNKFKMHFLQIVCNTDLKFAMSINTPASKLICEIVHGNTAKKGSELSRKELIKNSKEDLWVIPQDLLTDLRQLSKELIWGYGFTTPGSAVQR